jgi:hypothetical protein
LAFGFWLLAFGFWLLAFGQVISPSLVFWKYEIADYTRVIFLY